MKLTTPKIAFLLTAAVSWWGMGRYARTGRAVVRTLAAEASASMDKTSAETAAARVKALTSKDPSPGKMLTFLADIDSISSISELRALFEASEKFSDPWKMLAQKEITRRWVTLDPKSAASYAAAHQNEGFMLGFIKQWATGLTADQLAASITDIFGDPRNFAALIPSAPANADFRNISPHETETVLGGLHPLTALQAWAKLGYAKIPADSVYALFQSAGAKNQDAAKALALSIPDEESRKIALDAVLSGLGTADPVKALTQLSEDARTKGYQLNTIFNNLGRKDPQQGIESLELLPAADRDLARFFFCSAWSSQDPVAAFKYAQDNLAPPFRAQMARTLQFHTSTPLDREQISQLQDPTMRALLTGANLTKTLEQSPQSFATEWTQMTPQQHAEAISGLADNSFSTSSLASHWHELHPMVITLRGAALEQALSGGGLGNAWAQQDPISLLVALENHPPTSAADKAAEAAIRALATQDLPAATNIVMQMPPGPRRSAAEAVLPAH